MHICHHANRGYEVLVGERRFLFCGRIDTRFVGADRNRGAPIIPALTLGMRAHHRAPDGPLTERMVRARFHADADMAETLRER
jgi:hypothetical protein